MSENDGGDGEDKRPDLHVVGGGGNGETPRRQTRAEQLAVAAQRKEEFVDLRIAGVSFRQMAKQYHVSVSTAFRTYRSGLAEDMKMREADADEHREMIMGRVRAGLRAVWPAYMRGNVAAGLEVYRLCRLEIDMFGLKEPMKVDITVQIREIADRYGMNHEAAIDEAQRIILEMRTGKR